ncbi:uncharacterized protein LOC120276191 [Dioscorea cayenensis subsp. rotundata]|uniref:Uncharacterized protein LOC120276191 n=1 Tax=Dioscorea cayennensis subsp. rotundata TaxID=55577 RepID=A0AB40CG85_DIOCR|nr:uncharacterized protein LOC120276191 [Dioscorea cayenensis subsp. rotundata]
MAKQLNRKPTYGEVFNRTHKRAKGLGDYIDNKSKSVSDLYTSSMSEKYGADESCHPEFDPQLWCDAIGGMETTRTHVYGFGTTPRGKSFLSPTNSIGEACSTTCSPQVDQTPHSNTEVDNLTRRSDGCEEQTTKLGGFSKKYSRSRE